MKSSAGILSTQNKFGQITKAFQRKLAKDSNFKSLLINLLKSSQTDSREMSLNADILPTTAAVDISIRQNQETNIKRRHYLTRLLTAR